MTQRIPPELEQARHELYRQQAVHRNALREIEAQIEVASRVIRDSFMDEWRKRWGINLHLGDSIMITKSLITYKYELGTGVSGSMLEDAIGKEALIDHFEADNETFWVGTPVLKNGMVGGYTTDVPLHLVLEMRKAWLEAQKVAQP